MCRCNLSSSRKSVVIRRERRHTASHEFELHIHDNKYDTFIQFLCGIGDERVHETGLASKSRRVREEGCNSIYTALTYRTI